MKDLGADPRPDLAQQILSRQDQMEQVRFGYEPVWDLVSEFCAPDEPRTNFKGRSAYLYDNQAANTERRGSRIYANTIGSAVDRLCAGLESLITPQSEKWHGFSTAAMNDKESEEEKEWGEGLRDFLFDIRYSPSANFVPGIQGCYRNIVRFGPAYLYAEPGWGEQLIYYCSIPINEGFISRNRWGEVDIFHRRYQRTARQVAQMMGYKNLPSIIQEMANDPAKREQKVELIHAIQPRDERKMYNLAGEWIYLDSPVASYHVLEQEAAIVLDKSFQTFPISCFNWRRAEGDAYGVSPTINALVTVREENEVRRTGLRALQQQTDPALGGSASLDFTPILNPGEFYSGVIDENGRQMIQPIVTGANPAAAFEYAQSRAEEIRDMLYVNLFQVLLNNPNMTATEALIRQEEKGSLLGPAGSIIQRGIAVNADRELSILEAKGLYDADSRFAPPESLAGKQIRPTFTSPLDILRRAAEARDTIQVVTVAGQLATASQDPSVMDNIDSDEALKVIQSAGRSPARIMRRKDEVEALRASRAKAAEAQAGAAAMANAAKMAKDAVPALATAKQSGMLDGMPGLTPQTPPAGSA